MSSTWLYRLSGLSLAWGGALVALGYLLHPPDSVAALSNPMQIPVHLMIFFGILLLICGLIGLYTRQFARVGILGLLGLLLLCLGLLMIEMPHTMFALGLFPLLPTKAHGHELDMVNAVFSTPSIGLFSMVSIPAALLGILFTGIMTLRAHVVSRWIGITFLCIIALNFLSFVPGLVDIIHFPAEIYMAFALIGVLFLANTPTIGQPVGKSTPISTDTEAHPVSGAR